MLAKDLIKLLEQKIKDHEPMKDMMGDLQIVVDLFEKVPDEPNGCRFQYAGWSPHIRLDFDITNGNYIINSFCEESDTQR